MLRERKVKSKVLVFLLSFTLIFQSLGFLSLKVAKAVDEVLPNPGAQLPYDVRINPEVSYKQGNRIPIIANVIKLNMNTTPVENIQYSIKLFNGDNIVGTVSQGQENFKIVYNENYDSILAYFQGNLPSGDYKAVVLVKEGENDPIEIGNSNVVITKEDVSLSPKYINSDAIDFRVNINNLGGELLKDINKDNLIIELRDSENSLVGKTSTQVNIYDPIQIFVNGYTLNPFVDERVSDANISGTINATTKLQPGIYSIVLKKLDGSSITLDNPLNIEVTDSVCVTNVSSMGTNSILAPGVREFDIQLNLNGSKNKSSLSLQLKDSNDIVVAESTSSEYNWYNPMSKESSAIYKMAVIADKNIEAGQTYYLKINSAYSILVDENILKLIPQEYLTLTNFDTSKGSQGIIKGKLINFQPNQEIRAELFDNSNGDFQNATIISTCTAIPSTDGTIIFSFKGADNSDLRLQSGRYGVRFYAMGEFQNEYNFSMTSFDVSDFIKDTVKEIYGSSVNVINTNTKSFYTRITLKNIIPDKTSTDIKLLDKISGQEVGIMNKDSIQIKYTGNDFYGASLYEIFGLINVTGSIAANSEFVYSIQCGSEVISGSENFPVIATDNPSIDKIFINQAQYNEQSFISANLKQLDVDLFGAVNIADTSKLDVQFINTSDQKNYVTLDQASISEKAMDEFSKDISLKLNVNENETLLEGMYEFIVKYNGVELKRDNYLVTSSPMYRNYYFAYNTSLQENKIKIAFYGALNLDPSKMEISLTDINNNTIPLVVVNDSIKFEYDNLYFDAAPVSNATLSIGKYVLNVKQDSKDLTEVDSNQNKGNIISVTEKPVIYNVAYERTTDNKTNYVITSSELNTSAAYKAIFYRNDQDRSNRTSVKELPLTVTEEGKLVISEDQLQGLEQTDYEIFIEKDDIILANIYIYYKITMPMPEEDNTPKTASFRINNGGSYTNNKNVSLAITCTGYTQFRVANSEQELASAEYGPITEQKSWILSEGDGEKTVYLQLKDDNGTESEVISNKIYCDSTAPVKPEILSPSQGENIQLNSYLGIKAASSENIKLFAEICKVEGENITVLKTISLYTTGLEGSKYSFFRGLNIDSTTEGANLVRVYAEDYAGNKSELAEQPISVFKYGSLKGLLTKLDKPAAFSSIEVRKKNGENYEYYRWLSTNEKGEYSIDNLEPGDYQLYVYAANGYNEITENVTIASGAAVEKNLAFTDVYAGNRGSIKIVAKDKDNNPVPGVQVSVNNWSLQQYNYKDTDINGEALFENLPAGEGYNYYFYNNGISKFKDNITVVKSETKEEAVTVPIMKPISGKVTDKDDNPMKDVEIRIEGKDENGNLTYNWGRTDELGQYSVNVEDGQDYSVALNTINNALFTYYAETKNESIAAGTANVDITVYKGLSIYGKVIDENGAALSGLDVYAINRDNWSSFRVKTDSNGEYRFGSVLGIGNYEINVWKPGYTSDSLNVRSINITSLKNPSATITYNEGDPVPVAESSININDIKLNKYDMNEAFKGGTNRVTTDTALTQRGKDITVKVTYQNQSPLAINNVKIKANIPQGITLVPNSGALEKTVASIAAGATGEMTFMLHVGDTFDGDNFIVSAEASYDNNTASIGYASVEIVNATINGPSKDSDGTFKLYGEATAGSKVTIMDKVSGRVFAVTKPIGKWYSVDIKAAAAGNYDFVAKVEKDGKAYISSILKVEVKQDIIEVENVSFKTYSGQNVGINEETGVPAFSVWVNGQLEGKDITAYAKLTKALEAGYTVSYEFLGKTYAATLENGQWTTTITGWSGSGIEKVYLVIKDSNGNEVFRFTVAELIILIDPSGYVYDKVTSERIKGATAICEIKDANGNWVKWDAEKYGQVNPQITDEEGKYGWMVPAGEYRVKIQMTGYKDYVTTGDASIEPIIIPPPRTDVNIALEKIVKFEVSKVTAANNKILVTLTKDLDSSTINAANVKVLDENANEVGGTVLANGKEITFTPTTNLKAGSYSISLKDAIKDTDGISLNTYAQGFVITSEEAKVDLKDFAVDSFNLGTTSKVTMKATNYFAEDKEVTLIVALYDKTTNKMIKYSSDHKTIASGDSGDFEASIVMPATGEYKVKYFVWDTLKDMNPYMEAQTVE